MLKLKKNLGRKVDVATVKGLQEYFREQILREAVLL
jgi:predicted nucleotidyltransferase